MALNLEQRVSLLEEQVATLQRLLKGEAATSRAWVDDIYGRFADDPLFEQAMKLGRKYRRWLRARADKKKPTR
jgi:hypothetical protein